jgi:hypothetical protein
MKILLEVGSVLCFAGEFFFLLDLRLMTSLPQSMDGFLEYRMPGDRLRVRCHCCRYRRWLCESQWLVFWLMTCAETKFFSV